MSDDPLRGLRQAYADTFEEQDSQQRCLHFLMAEWLDETQAKRAAMLIGDYGMFDTSLVTKRLENVAEVDPGVRFTFGREMSPVLYVETEFPDRVEVVLDDMLPQELHQLTEGETVGNVRDYDEPHAHCKHDDPPVENGEWAGRRKPGANYFRVWWDDG